VIGGRSETAGLESPLKLKTKVLYFDVRLTKSGQVYQDIIPKGYQGFTYLIKGSGKLQQEASQLQAQEKSCVLFTETQTDSSLVFESTSDDVHMLVIAGEPMNEPMARYGPFVMNTEQEIRQAFLDYRSGNFFKHQATSETF